MSDGINKEDVIILDSDLGNGIRGEVEGRSIYQLGFSNLYISTNYVDGSIIKPAWIKRILSKNPEEVFNEIDWTEKQNSISSL
ncbi:MAG TPA: hypothetical protein VNJ01_00690 [Bacteriovoracaceae bacterium]|nr:hypothetical protein [Bacteriovoracaceae bacterium]